MKRQLDRATIGILVAMNVLFPSVIAVPLWFFSPFATVIVKVLLSILLYGSFFGMVTLRAILEGEIWKKRVQE